MPSVHGRVPVLRTTTGSRRTVFDGGDHFHDPQLDDAESAEPTEKERIFLEALAKSGPAELKRVSVRVRHGHVRLVGQVSSFYSKQLAQEVLRPFAIGLQIDNALQVIS